jgi:leucyl aminopeptidase
MSFPSLARSAQTISQSSANAVVLVLPDLEEFPDATAGYAGLAQIAKSISFTGGTRSYARVYAPEVTELPLAVVGVGKHPSSGEVRRAVGAAIRSLTSFENVAVFLAPGLEEFGVAAAEGAVLGGYRFENYRKDPGKPRATTVTLPESLLSQADLEHATVVGEAVAMVKDLVSTPAEWLSPANLAEKAVSSVADLDVKVTVLDEKQLAAEGWGGILGVGLGSDRPPRMVRLDYSPKNANGYIALVGKGITFDTGGLSLKPANSMVGMKYDMCGAATSLAVLRAVASLKLPVKMSAWLAIADNMPSGRATRPGDVLRMLDGTTVEVLNTDAEGRLVLGDGLAAASREHPDVIIDIATLTGAITVALGTRHVGVMGEDDAVEQYLAAAESADELAWHLPLPEHMVEELESPIADLVNAKVGDPAGGSLFAGLFLRHFVGRVSDEEDAPRIPWVHLDIAGVGDHKGAAYGFTDKGPTGATVRSLIAFAENFGKE